MGRTKRLLLRDRAANRASGTSDPLGRNVERNTERLETVKMEDVVEDEVDQFHHQREKILLERSGSMWSTGNSSEDEPLLEGEVEEVMPLLDSDSDSEDSQNEESNDETEDYGANVSGDEESEADDPQVLSQAWGHSKSTYYNTDYVDDEMGASSDEELAEEEEREALDMQQRLAGLLEDKDFGIEPLMESSDVVERSSALPKQTPPHDLAGLSDEDKIKWLYQESPEFMDLYLDCKSKLKEDKNILSPLVQSARTSALPVTAEGLDYLETKSMLSKVYCLNIVYYLYLKAQCMSVKDHPVVARIVQLRELLGKFCSVDSALNDDVTDAMDILDKLPSDNQFRNPSLKFKSKPIQSQEATTECGTQDIDKRHNCEQGKQVTFDDPLMYYEEVKSAKMRRKLKRAREREMSNESNKAEAVATDSDRKRAITYQIARNQGLMPKRKKEQRNPRVRHRKKFHKALIKYKSTVQPIQFEMQRYSGERTGIKANLTRSVKIK